MLSCSTLMPLAVSSFGISTYRPAVAGPIAVISKVPGNWKPCSGLSDLISIARLLVRRGPNPRSAERPAGRTLPTVCLIRAAFSVFTIPLDHNGPHDNYQPL